MQTKYGDSGVSPRVNSYAAVKMLEHAKPHLVLEKFGLVRPMPQNKSQTIKFRRPVPFTASTAPLSEGVTPTPRQFQYEDVTANLNQYGDLVEITDAIEDTHEDPVLNDAAMICGENLGRTKEALAFAALKAGTNVFYANGASRAAVNTKITLAKQRAVVRSLQANKALKMTRMLDASVEIGTTPIEAAYIGVCHSDVAADIRDLAGFTPVAEYGSRKPLHENELGSVEDVRYICSADMGPWENAGGTPGGTVLSTGGSAADVYPVLYFGQDAYGHVPLRGENAVEPTILRPGVKDKSDPLGQRGYVGWKCWYTAKILNENWMARLEVGASEL
jgi:N4-gp56 family major capsid protein